MPRTSLHRVWQARALGFAALAVTALIVAALAVTNTNAAPTVTTDKADYHPSDTVIITGGGFAPNTFYDVPVVRPDGSVVKGDGTLTLGWDSVFTNGSGAFTYNYKLDGVLGSYQVKVYPYGWNGNFSEAPLASTTFTDSPLITDFRQCSNKNPTLGDCVWISSIIQSSNSTYRESMSTPQRLVFDNITTQPGDVHTLTFSHQATKGGTHGYDWLTSYGQAIAGAAATPDLAYTNVVAGDFTNAEACDATIGPPGTLGATCLSLRSGPNSFVVDVTDDTYIDSTEGATLPRILAYEGVYGNRTIKIYGDSPITAASLPAPTHTGPDTGDSDANYTLTWTSASTRVLIEMGGHLAVTGTAIPWGWGPLQGASQISGGPYHFKLDMHDGSSLGSQDNQIKGADIQIVKGKIIIVKDAIPDNAQNFGFTCSGTTPLTFPLDDDADGTLSNTQSFMSLDPGTYTCSEDALPAGWSLTSLVCSDPDGGSSVNLGTRTATIDVDAGETITCTFTDTGAGTITIIKDAVPNDAQDFSFSGTCFTAFSLDDDANGTLSNIKGPESHIPGTCTVIEDAPPSPPWNLTGLSCVDPSGGTTTNLGTRTGTIDLAAGESVTCTFTNTKDGTIKITKDAIPNDPQNFSFSGDLGVFTLDDDSDGALSNMFGPVTKTPGSYMVSEDAPPSSWTLTGISCSGDLDNGNVVDLPTRKVTIDLDPGEDQVCVFTNATGAITIVKNSVPDDPQDFSFSGAFAFLLDDDGNGTLPTTFVSNSSPGSYTVTEAAVSGWDLTSIICTGDTDLGNTYSSTSVTIDLDAGESQTCTFTNTKRGSIVVEKQTGPDGAIGSFTFTGDAAGTISDNGTITVGNLVPGTYSSTENNPAPAFDLTSLVCNDGASATPSTGNVGTRTATFQVDPGETVKCTFTNTKRGTIIVEKQTVPDGAAGSFTFTGDAAGTISDNGTITAINLVPGTYSSTENDPSPAFILTSLICDDGASATPSSGNVGTRTATFNLDPGETVKCTFTNTKQPTLTVNKVIIPASDPGQFNLRIDGTTHASCVGNGGSTGSVIVSIGAHVVDETACVGTNLGDYSTVISGDCTTGGAVTLAAGDNKTCTITNTRNGTIKIIKDAVPDDLVQDFSFTCSPGLGTFTLDDDAGADLTFSNMETFTNVTPGPYTCNENGPPGGWALTGLSCSDPDFGTTTDLGTATASIDLDPGETVTCTFTDTKKGTIIVEKQTIPNGALGSFTFTGAAAGTISDNGTLMSSVAPGTYMSTENDPTPAFALTSILCDDSNSSGNVGLRTATFVVEPGETVTCTFTNTQQPKLTVNKVCVPVGDPGLFNLQIDGVTQGANAPCGGTTGPKVVTVGPHTVGETAGTGTNLANYTTVIGGDCAANGAVSLAAGDNKTCTITNTRKGTIIIIKDAVPDDAQNFTFSGTCLAAFSLDDDADGALLNTKNELRAPGVCTVVEDGPPAGWVLFNLQCIDPSGGTTISVATRTASIDLAAAETVTCTFTNQKLAKLTVCKDVVPDDGTVWDFQLVGPTPGTRDDLADEECHPFNNLTPGNYTLSETFQAPYLPSVNCGAGSVPGTTIALTLASGADVTCTFVNTLTSADPPVGGIAGLVEQSDATPAEDADRPVRGEMGAIIIFIVGLIGAGAWFIRRRALA